jgi:hypothetical protein
MPTRALQAQGDSLEVSARKRFSNLTLAELKLIRSVGNEGEVAFCGPSVRDDDPLNDPSHSDEWGRDRQIRAELIRWLCIEESARKQIDPQGMRIHGAKIVSELYLSHAVIRFPLAFWRCALTGNAHLRDVDVPELDFSGSSIRELDADGAFVRGDLFLRDKFIAHGQINLVEAHIDGDFDCSGGSFLNPPVVGKSPGAIVADGTIVGGGVLFTRYSPNNSENSRPTLFHAEGEVRLLHAQIGMNLDCSGGVFLNRPHQEHSRERQSTKCRRNQRQGERVSQERNSRGGFLRGGRSADTRRPSRRLYRMRWRDLCESGNKKPWWQHS